MAYDIGPKIGIEGEPEFRKAITQINQTVKTLGTEMAAATSAYDKNDKSAENLTSQNKVLNKQIEAQRDKLEKVKEMLAASAKETGENSTQTQKWQAVVNTATADLNKMERQLRENNEALKNMDSLDDIFQDADNLANELKNMAGEALNGGAALTKLDGSAQKPAKSISALTVAMGSLISSGLQKVGAIIGEAASAIVNLDKATEEYRIAQGKLNTAFESAGKSVESAKETYTEFYKILGDTDTAAEASQLLAKLADDEEDLSKWTEIAAGVYGTFGDALPINGLIEAANETVKTGKVTGVLADALNWAGISEDSFNESLSAASDESERNKMLMDTLSGVYDEASDAFYRNNEAVVEARENQARLDEVTGKLGDSVSRVKNALLEKFGPALADIGSKAADFIGGLDIDNLFSGFDSVKTFFSSLWETVEAGLSSAHDAISSFVESIQPLIDSISGAFSAAWDAIQAAWDLAEPYFSKLWDGIKAVFDVVKDVLSSYFSMAWDNIKIVWDTVVDYFSTIWDTISGIFSVVEAVLSGDFQGAWDAIQGIFEDWGEFFSGLWDNVGEIFANVWEFFSDIGGDIVDGIKQGISYAWSNFKKWVSDKFNGLVSGVKELLGINSPSKVFAGIGGYMAEGLAVGFGKEMPDVQRRIDRSMADLVDYSAGEAAAPAGTPYGPRQGPYSQADMVAAFREAMSGMGVYMNGRKVGNMVTTQQGRDARAAGGYAVMPV